MRLVVSLFLAASLVVALPLDTRNSSHSALSGQLNKRATVIADGTSLQSGTLFDSVDWQASGVLLDGCECVPLFLTLIPPRTSTDPDTVSLSATASRRASLTATRSPSRRRVSSRAAPPSPSTSAAARSSRARRLVSASSSCRAQTRATARRGPTLGRTASLLASAPLCVVPSASSATFSSRLTDARSPSLRSPDRRTTSSTSSSSSAARRTASSLRSTRSTSATAQDRSCASLTATRDGARRRGATARACR